MRKLMLLTLFIAVGIATGCGKDEKSDDAPAVAPEEPVKAEAKKDVAKEADKNKSKEQATPKPKATPKPAAKPKAAAFDSAPYYSRTTVVFNGITLAGADPCLSCL